MDVITHHNCNYRFRWKDDIIRCNYAHYVNVTLQIKYTENQQRKNKITREKEIEQIHEVTKREKETEKKEKKNLLTNVRALFTPLNFI